MMTQMEDKRKMTRKMMMEKREESKWFMSRMTMWVDQCVQTKRGRMEGGYKCLLEHMLRST